MNIYIDFETRSCADLSKVGACCYAQDSSTQPICLAWASDLNSKGYSWKLTDPHPPQELFDLLPFAEIHAWNAQFDYAIWNDCCVPQLGWPRLVLQQMRDTMAQAAVVGLPQKLNDTAEVLGLGSKLPGGKGLIQLLSKPRKGHFILPNEDPESYMVLYNYCRRDVELLQEISKKLPPLSQPEQAYWRHTVLMNRRGIPVDRLELTKIVENIDYQIKKLDSMTPVITRAEVGSVNQIAKLKEWIGKTEGGIVNSLNKASVKTMLSDPSFSPATRKILKIRQLVGLTTNAKFKKALDKLCNDNTVKDNLRYYGAHTGRLSGAGLQIQNLLRDCMDEKEAEVFFSLLINVKPEDMDWLYHGLLRHISRAVRCMIKAPPGYKFICADFASIEAVGTPWIANEVDILKAISHGLDQYKVSAAGMFKVAYDSVTKRQRQAGKITVLACGYSGGEKALKSMAEGYGLVIPKAIRMEYVTAFRNSRKKLVDTWAGFRRAAYKTVYEGIPSKVDTSQVVFHKVEDALCMRLPNGRDLYYPHVTLKSNRTPWGADVRSVAYWDYKTKSLKFMTGGNFFQNAVQAVCRDLLMEAQLRLEKKGYKIIMSVHDECIALVPDTDNYSLEEFIDIMTQVPKWATGFPIKADGWEGYRYHK